MAVDILKLLREFPDELSEMAAKEIERLREDLGAAREYLHRINTNTQDWARSELNRRVEREETGE